MNIASEAEEASSKRDAFDTSRPVSSVIIVWKFNSDSSLP